MTMRAPVRTVRKDRSKLNGSGDSVTSVKLRSNWRQFRSTLSKETIALAERTEANGHAVFVMDANLRSHRVLICPVENQPYQIGFRDTDGQWHHELTVQVQQNALSINYLEDAIKSRPAHPTFTIGNGIESYHPQIEEEYPELTGESLREDSAEWLSRRELIIIRYSADDGLVNGEFVAPREMAHVLQQLTMLHKVYNYRQLKKMRSQPNSTFWCAPGLRRTLFDGKQNATLYPEADGSMFIIGNSVYEGLLPGKKPTFNDIAWKRWVRDGMACHASIATVRPVGKFAQALALAAAFAVMIFCDSGRGKTELRKLLEVYFNQGRLLLGFRRDRLGKLRALSIPYLREHLLEWISEGDDGVSVRSFVRGKLKRFLGINWELGAFDRNSGAYGEGDIEELDRMQKLSRGWWELRMVNIVAQPGDRIEHWQRVRLENGEPCANPRVTYSNALLRRAGILTRRALRPIKHGFFAFARVPGVTCVGPWTKLSSALGALYEILGGPDAFRSKSVAVARVPQEKVVPTGKRRPAKFAHFGSMGQFSPVSVRGQVEQILKRHVCFPGTQYWLITQEERPSAEELGRALTTAEKEIEYLPEMLLRDLLILEELEIAKVVWRVSPYPFLGFWPERVRIGKTNLPREFFDPELIYGQELLSHASAWYREVCDELDHLEHLGITDDARQLFDYVRQMYGPERVVRPMDVVESKAVIQSGERLLKSLLRR